MVKRVMFVYLSQEEPGYATLRGRPNYNIRRRPQIGFQYLAAVLEKAGVDSIILDQTITPFTVEELAVKIKDTRSDIVGFYTVSVLKDKVKSYISGLKNKIEVPIIIGGPGSANSREYLEAGCAMVCDGEGEKSILDIVDYYNGKREINSIEGISYMESGRLVKNKPQEMVADLDALPFPRRNIIPIQQYHDYYIFTMKKPYVTMITSRGCPMSCTFCSSPFFWGKKYRLRSADNVLKEVDYLKKTFGIRYIAFLDDIFGFDETWLREFCEGLIQRKYAIKWMCILHPFSLRKSREEFLDLLKEAGCDTVSFGLQSASPQILKNIKRRPEEPAELKKTIATAKKKGFLTYISIIFGLPGETRDTIRDTIDYCCDLRPTYAEFSNLYLLDGSEIEATYKTKENVCGISKGELDDWCRYAAKRFYLHPSQIFEISKIIITKNPYWLGVALKNYRHLLKAAGC